jgi:hypothetical protein
VTSILFLSFQPDLTIADPICTLIFSTMSVLVSLNVFKDIMKVFLEGKSTRYGSCLITERSYDGRVSSGIFPTLSTFPACAETGIPGENPNRSLSID